MARFRHRTLDRGEQHRSARCEVFHDHRADRRLQLVPITGAVFRHGNKVGAKEDPSHLGQGEQPFRQRRQRDSRRRAGHGQALETARRGDADLVLVQAAEDFIPPLPLSN
jgi:hypothetical protein